MKSVLKRLFPPGVRSETPSAAIIVVSGLPRSGTSLMMKMLEAGGLPVLTDHVRQANPDNPEGYFEFERVKALDKGDDGWLGEAEGKVVKVISALLRHLPSHYSYRVIFMHRNIDEVLASQKKMMERRGAPTDGDDAALAALFRSHVSTVSDWLAAQPNFSVLNINYNVLLDDPESNAQRVNRFLGGGLNERDMVAAVNPRLYRNRASDASTLTR